MIFKRNYPFDGAPAIGPNHEVFQVLFSVADGYPINDFFSGYCLCCNFAWDENKDNVIPYAPCLFWDRFPGRWHVDLLPVAKFRLLSVIDQTGHYMASDIKIPAKINNPAKIIQVLKNARLKIPDQIYFIPVIV